MRQCTVKPAWIGHALKRTPYWEGQTRLIPSLFYMLSFHAFLKRKTVKRTLLQTDNIFSPQLKKNILTYADTKIARISEKQRIKLDIFVNFLKKKHFFTLQSNNFFYFNLKFWRSANLLTRTRYLLFQVSLCNELTIVFAPLKAISIFKPYYTPCDLLVSALWLTLSFGEVSKTCRKMH